MPTDLGTQLVWVGVLSGAMAALVYLWRETLIGWWEWAERRMFPSRFAHELVATRREDRADLDWWEHDGVANLPPNPYTRAREDLPGGDDDAA
jgi:hypothetical protein